ncbi:hypothetical protein CAPTEDRAFT_211635 [Capitella teleta]|uniref:Uncharacterized protein n=1 Tax=Capitella teleta TaxID=283909 RepID=R7TDM5_CAPTE|nr:hypothetical protein CAPTEDRAFT_211635 [Capitella teleta]|eukprot:ELT91617.1 hypothetical protein CAPTEDRAFT_211635 [Capitella teleta]
MEISMTRPPDFWRDTLNSSLPTCPQMLVSIATAWQRERGGLPSAPDITKKRGKSGWLSTFLISPQSRSPNQIQNCDMVFLRQTEPPYLLRPIFKAQRLEFFKIQSEATAIPLKDGMLLISYFRSLGEARGFGSDFVPPNPSFSVSFAFLSFVHIPKSPASGQGKKDTGRLPKAERRRLNRYGVLDPDAIDPSLEEDMAVDVPPSTSLTSPGKMQSTKEEGRKEVYFGKKNNEQRIK